MMKFLAATLAGIFLVALYLAIEVYSYSDNRHQASADAAVVLGAAVWSDRPSPVFRERINHAINLYKEGVVKKLIFTGGLAQGDDLAESEAARQYALSQGVADEDVLIETVSHNTCENLLQARQIIQSHNLGQVLVVSDPMHMRRAMWLAEEVGLNALPSPTPTTRYQSFSSTTAFLFREMYYSIPSLLGIHRCTKI
jgi:uncharacterized SAM-binding protein YcdF (DUF218 family)